MASSDRDESVHSTDDEISTSTPDATELDPTMLDEVEQALDAVRKRDSSGIPPGGPPRIPQCEMTPRVPQAETSQPYGYLDTDEAAPTTDRRPVDYDG